MKKRTSKYDIYIVELTVILLVFFIYINENKVLAKDKLYQEKYKAAITMQECSEKIKQEKILRGININPQEDKNLTGLIGTNMNGITTTLGSLESKRTSTNPNFAAVMIDMMEKAGLKSGDYVAVNFSSSFPALNISTIIACEVLNIEPIIITSIGSSTYGGNNLEFTYLDMEEFLYNEGLIKNKSVAISPGGSGDVGKDMNKEDLYNILNRMNSFNKIIIFEENLERNIEIRKQIYLEGTSSIKAFINVGGNLVAFGDTTDSINAPTGLITNNDFGASNKTGLIQYFNSRNVPVINILNINDLANRYGLPVDSATPYKVGEGNIYYTYSYPTGLIILVILASIFSLAIIMKEKNKS